MKTAHEQDMKLYLQFAAVVVAVVLLAALALFKIATPAPEAANVSSPVETVCEEDMPCWDCASMGNKVCGSGPTKCVNLGPGASINGTRIVCRQDGKYVDFAR